MRVHLVAYVQGSIISRWKRLVLKYACEGKPTFVYGSNDDRQFNRFARDGAVLWIVASHRDYPPTLVAKLNNVERIDEGRESTIPPGLLSELKPLGHGKKYRFKVRGARGSRFYGHNDAIPVLNELALLGNDGRIAKEAKEEWNPRKHGNMLQRPHRVYDASPLATFSDKLQRQTVFISWKHCDVKGRKHDNLRRRSYVKEFARELNKAEIAVWLDEFALPNYRPKTADDNLLELLLSQGLKQSRVVIAVASNQYGCRSPGSIKNWTKQEWQSKSKRNRVVLFSDAKQANYDYEGNSSCIDLHSASLRLSGRPSDASSEFSDWFE
jgi:hypothetical protein